MNTIKDLWNRVKQVINHFNQGHASRTAAAMAYYTLFSLFPLLIVLVTVISYFVNAQQASEQVTQLITGAIPVSHNLVERNINRVLEVRNSVGAIGLIGFLWSSSNAFYLLVDSINRAWFEEQDRSFFQKRLFGVVMVILLIIVLFLLMFASSVFTILMQNLPETFQITGALGYNLRRAAAGLVNWLAPFLFFLSLYRWVPSQKGPWKVVLGVSALITFLWRGASSLFKWYLASGFSRYELVFGSLSAIVVLLFWIYISSVIILLGAHINAVFSSEEG